MITKEQIQQVLEGYAIKGPGDIAIATLASHSFIQLANACRSLGLDMIAFHKPDSPEGFSPLRTYKMFPRATSHVEFLELEKWTDLVKPEWQDFLREKKAILVPHGSFVEYVGPGSISNDLLVPMYGNRQVLEWEGNRAKQREWLESAGVPLPRMVASPEEITEPVMAKTDGAKGGKGYFIAASEEEFRKKAKPGVDYYLQEYVLGTRYYVHLFYSPLSREGSPIGEKGSFVMLGMDRRDEANIDESYKLGSRSELNEHGTEQTFVVTGNVPTVMRESLLPKVELYARKTIERSLELFPPGVVGPFCLELAVTDNLDIKVFEVSTRIVAGTNVGPGPYADWTYGEDQEMTTGKRIMKEITDAINQVKLEKVVS
jgi:5-formaminoimidazole-4-carboxamide-1-(beta)-D-ribofuranosyl 5'-monophosphate synthetase